jgi:YhcH/YjgK/YiaL family protein
VAYFINQKNNPLEKVFPNQNLQAFIKNSIEQAKKLEPGAFEKLIYDGSIFSICQNTILKEADKCVYESHKKYIDIHIIVDGCERVDLIHIEKVLEPFESSDKYDYFLYKTNASSKSYDLEAGMLAIFLFEDVHKVGVLPAPAAENVVKVVLKVDKKIFEQELSYE